MTAGGAKGRESLRRCRKGKMVLVILGSAMVAGCAVPSMPEMPSMPSMPSMSFLPFVGGKEDVEGKLDISQVTAEKYCYRTLAKVDCYAKPQPGEEARRVDWFDSPNYPHYTSGPKD